MATRRRAIATPLRLVACAPFESVVLALAVVYIALHLSPSSYALALEQLGADARPLLGVPRSIRTDEWSVMTPLFETAVNNDFRETNETSFYRETLRSHIGLPLLNWGLVFKPLVWPFFVVPPALAYSFYWAANAALMLIGWSCLLRAFGFSRTVAAFASAILYVSPIVQAKSGAGPQLALFPWIVLAVVHIRSPIRVALALSVLVPAWLISDLYVPGIPPLFFLGLTLCVAFRPDIFRWPRVAGVVAGVTAGVAITAAYFAPVFHAYADSAYPGHRWTTGGALSTWQVASQFLPATTTEWYTNLIAANISEAATLASWLTLLTLFVVDVRAIRRRYATDSELRRDLQRLGALGAMWAVITLWQLVPLPPLSYAFGLGLSLEARTLFASGALLVISAAFALDRLPLRITPMRLAAFAGVVLFAWLLASFQLQTTAELDVRDELLVLPLVLGITPFAVLAGRSAAHASRVAILLVALVPAIIGWGLFNPLQSTRVMFEKPDTAATRELDELAAKRPDGAIAVSGFPGAMLNGIGYRSVTHAIVTPSPHLFRKYFPEMDEGTFNHIFSRYAQISLAKAPAPYVAGVDAVRVPTTTMARYASARPAVRTR